MNGQIKKGLLEMCVLFYISEEDDYGYPICKKINKYFPDVQVSTVYAILRRLKKEGLSGSYNGEESGGPERKYYYITDAGRDHLEELKAAWKEVYRVIDDMGINF